MVKNENFLHVQEVDNTVYYSVVYNACYVSSTVLRALCMSAYSYN